MKKFKTFIKQESIPEDAPVNAVSSGNIDGVGYGSKGEPGVKPGVKFRLKNMVTLLKRMKNV